MVRLRLCPVILILVATVAKISSYNITGRASASCAYLSSKIYCFEGVLSDAVDYPLQYNMDIFILDIHDKAMASGDLETRWTTASEGKNSDISTITRGYPQVVANPDTNTLLITGGKTDNWTLNANTIVYYTETGEWEVVDAFEDPNNGGERQIYHGTGVYARDKKIYYFYGGYQWKDDSELNRWFIDTPTGANLSNLPYSTSKSVKSDIISPQSNTLFIGYYRMTSLMLSNQNNRQDTWSLLSNIPQKNYFFQSAVYHQQSSTIYYFGGLYSNVTGYIDIQWQQFNESITFNTSTSEWSKQGFNDGPQPKPRIFHTTTLLPSLNDILLYGGAGSDHRPLDKFCYTVNLETFTWVYHSKVNFTREDSGARSEHAAVLVNTDVYILFGYNSTYQFASTILILDVSNITALSISNITPVQQQTQISKSVIGGIASGSLSGILILAVIIFYSKKKKILRKSGEDEISVDWDAIEAEFTKASPIDLMQSAEIKDKQPTSKPAVITIDIDNKIHASKTDNSGKRHSPPDISQTTKPDIGIPKS